MEKARVIEEGEAAQKVPLLGDEFYYQLEPYDVDEDYDEVDDICHELQYYDALRLPWEILARLGVRISSVKRKGGVVSVVLATGDVLECPELDEDMARELVDLLRRLVSLMRLG